VVRSPRPDRPILPSVRLGHAGPANQETGVSVLVFDRAALTVVDVRGGASGTYDTASLSLDATFGRRWAIFLSGGSLFGLDAGGGVRDAILREGGGHAVFHNPNRIAPVSGAILYDLPVRRWRAPDYRALGAAAVNRSGPALPCAGRLGAGCGARIGKYLGRGHSQPGALALRGETERRLGSVLALAVLNSVGAIREPSTGEWLAGARDSHGRLVPPDLVRGDTGLGTTLVALVTDVRASRPTLQRVAAFAQAGVARAVVPAHTATDGDAVFVSSVAPEERTPRRDADAGDLADRLGMLAERATVAAILAAARAATRAWKDSRDGGSSRGVPGSGRSS
jgi:L-aminopeptidase/D-esterase-like protein